MKTTSRAIISIVNIAATDTHCDSKYCISNYGEVCEQFDEDLEYDEETKAYKRCDKCLEAEKQLIKYKLVCGI
jgi:hypothetical protein